MLDINDPYDLDMYIPNSVGSCRIGNFVKEKHPVLSQLIQKPERLYIDHAAEKFSALLSLVLTPSDTSGLRIYFATYPANPAAPGAEFIPPRMENMLTLVYARTKQIQIGLEFVHKDTGEYYIFNHNGDIVQLTKQSEVAIAKEWVRNFNSIKYPLLDELLNNTGRDYPNPETKSIFYKKKSINDLNIFLKNEHGAFEDVPVHVTVFFATYHLDDPYDGTIEDKPNYAGKLTLVFGFMDAYRNGIYYYRNLKKYNRNPKEKMLKGRGIADEDTGVPCPPPICKGADLLDEV